MKRTLLLVRHAKSDQTIFKELDIERVLNARGLRALPVMRAALAEQQLGITHVVCSTAARTRLTANGLFGPDSEFDLPIALDERIYEASLATLLQVVAAQPGNVAALAVVGHNPGMTQAANHLVASLGLPNLSTCGMVACTADADTWADFVRKPTALLWFDIPKNHGA